MSKHKPGPWSYSMYEDTNYARIYLHDLGRMDKIKGGDSLRGYCGEANARLIAAAPEMFETLEYILSRLKALCDDDTTTDIRIVEEVIAKAQGELK